MLEAEGLMPSNPVHAARNARIRACRAELVAIAFHLARSEAEVHPTAILLLQRILTELADQPAVPGRVERRQPPQRPAPRRGRHRAAPLSPAYSRRRPRR